MLTMMQTIQPSQQIYASSESKIGTPYLQLFERMRYVLATGWGVEDERFALLLAALGHALDFQTWRSLVRQQGLEGG
jgi:hypothetical protein